MKMCYEFNIIHNGYWYEPIMKNMCHEGYGFNIIHSNFSWKTMNGCYEFSIIIVANLIMENICYEFNIIHN